MMPRGDHRRPCLAAHRRRRGAATRPQQHLRTRGRRPSPPHHRGRPATRDASVGGAAGRGAASLAQHVARGVPAAHARGTAGPPVAPRRLRPRARRGRPGRPVPAAPDDRVRRPPLAAREAERRPAAPPARRRRRRGVGRCAGRLGRGRYGQHALSPAPGRLAGSRRTDEVTARLLAELRLAFHAVASPQRLHEPYVRRNRALLDLLVAGDAEGAAKELGEYLHDSQAELLDAVRSRHASGAR